MTARPAGLRPRGPPIALRPEQLWERALFAATGRRLLISSLRQLAEAPEDLDGEGRALMQRRLGRALLDHLRVTLDIEGTDNLPHEPHVIVSLHEGMADALCLTQLPLAMRIVARQEIFEWPWIGPAIDRMRHIAIEPEEGATSYRRLLNEAQHGTRGRRARSVVPARLPAWDRDSVPARRFPPGAPARCADSSGRDHRRASHLGASIFADVALR